MGVLRRLKTPTARGISGLALAAILLLAPASALGRLVYPLPGDKPLSDAAAARKVHHSSWEPRPDNYAATHTVPSQSDLAYFYAHSQMPLARYVTGNFRGTTDEVIQWAAHKWGFDPELFRAVATVETWWHMSFVGNDGSAFGLFQVRVPYHCCLPEIQTAAAFNADYYGANLRAIYSGLYGWLNQVPHGRTYRAGDLWGSVGEWAAGRWYLGDSQWYAGQVRMRLSQRTWATDVWF